MVAAPDDYVWSSYRANGLAQPIKVWAPHRVYRELGATIAECSAAYRELFAGQLDRPTLNTIRQATNQGMALGNDRFKAEIERLTGRRVKPLRSGPKCKASGKFLH